MSTTKSRTHSEQQKSTSSGFTLIEVLVGILMSTAFVLITTQAIAISAIYRVRAQRESEAQLWIQEDLSDIKFKSLQALTATSCDPADGSTIDGYAFALAKKVDPSVTTLPWSPSLPEIVLLNKDYDVTRTLDVYNSEPYHVMTVSYSITDPAVPEASNSLNYEITNFYTEVIPDAAFNCQ